MSPFVLRSPGQERAAPCAQDVGLYELAGARNPRGVHVPCAPCLGELGGHQEPDVVAAEHRQQLLGHLLQEAGRRVRTTEQHLRHEGRAEQSSCPPGPAAMLTGKNPARTSPGAVGRCLAWSGSPTPQLPLWGSCCLSFLISEAGNLTADRQ